MENQNTHVLCALRYKGRRLRGAFRFAHGAAVYSRDAVRLMLEHNADAASDVREDEAIAKLLARSDADALYNDAGVAADSAVRLRPRAARQRATDDNDDAAATELPRVAASWAALLALPNHERNIFRLVTPTDLRASRSAKPALMLNERGEVVVCCSSGETQAMKGHDKNTAPRPTLEVFAPAGVDGAGEPPFVQKVDADALAQRSASHYRARGVGVGEHLDELTIVVLDTSTSMEEPFLPPRALQKQDVLDEARRGVSKLSSHAACGARGDDRETRRPARLRVWRRPRSTASPPLRL